MKLHDVVAPSGARHSRKRVGRGEASGLGKTSGKGNKGQKARSGGGKGSHFEGGQMPLYRRLPKRGFKNPFRVEYEVVNLRDLARFPEVSEFDPETMIRLRLVKGGEARVKVLAEGEIDHAVTVRAHGFSGRAAEKIRAAGGQAEVV
ncbi:MAG: 50S ribosomal protein L15 [Nitrospirae bacterium CG18_big_fil_WC_8_21_14_2_50_70_55]|nr:50S ribosomal protein L15 [Deltaproteobacteria bacterium]OIP67013.1 MAG: 50S ribosomal protein L15 [Nitrospirae bacterium CG2_30_70_394]PIQ07280.1 MAG: 50S ribosomal protein L15 [Nitrospirae bacterium CG18_big_fil_WC_8_21_14_2_50_70_55]PIU80145.1 MAG: 50S ribosomal protein L15 [Nitrospirae bacterium CG06_land_8_20_14_3_00_70_43]PIW82680.1 MAG: 50S ribosomal protein L15 [Nitrospirae bacterium CG_4_8_14_3_um_filter_70_85]PIX84041.1 MAG: 50S ribosomal protein L15 [Nitrospirae bacterium CG_4_10